MITLHLPKLLLKSFYFFLQGIRMSEKSVNIDEKKN